MMQTPAWVHQLFKTVDAMDAEGFVSYLTEGVRFRYGSGPEIVGREKIQEMVGGVFKTLASLRHRILETWTYSDIVICQGEVTYTRKDGSQIILPFMNLYRMKGQLIDQYLVYIDISPLYSPDP